MRKWLFTALMAVMSGTPAWPGTAHGAGNCGASYTIDLTVELNSEMTQGKNDLMIELRRGAVGNSTVADTKRFSGRTGIVAFTGMCVGSYFVAIGNGDKVAVGPVRQFNDAQRIHTRVTVSYSSGNVGTRSRSGI